MRNMKTFCNICTSALLTLLLALPLASCNDTPKLKDSEFLIIGKVVPTDRDDLEGAKVFLVPIRNFSLRILDSTYVKNGSFTFRGDSAGVYDIRLEKFRRLGIQSLLVVTEPGIIHATIGPVSSSYGTRSNDSLQAWKEYKQQIDSLRFVLNKEGKIAQRDSVTAAFKARTHNFIDNIGEGPLYDFILSLYPKNKKPAAEK